MKPFVSSVGLLFLVLSACFRLLPVCSVYFVLIFQVLFIYLFYLLRKKKKKEVSIKSGIKFFDFDNSKMHDKL